MSPKSLRARAAEEDQPTHLRLLSLLREGHALTQAEITDRLPIESKRQARRLVKKLKRAGVPIKEARRGRKKEYRLPPGEWDAAVRLDLTEREALALLLAAGAAESGLGPAPLEGALAGATESLVEGLPSGVDTFEPSSLMEQVHFGEAASVDVDPEVFIALIEALTNRRSIEIDYYSASSDTLHEGRRVDPWGLAMRGDAWLCVAHDYRSGERRDFNLARIQEVRPHWPESNGGDYQVPEEFDLELYFIDRFESLDAETVYEVRLLLEKEVVPYFESKSYHRTQQLHREDPALEESDLEEGSERAVASFEVAGLEEIAAFVRSWGTGVKVLSPPELAERIAEEARAVAEQYR